MADSKITALASLSATPDATDLFVLVDVSDTSMDAAGTDKKITFNTIENGIIDQVYIQMGGFI